MENQDQFFLELETKWMTAWQNKNEAVARDLLADEFTLTSSLSKNELVNKESWIDKAINHYHCRSFRFDKVTSRVYGEVAILNIWYHQEAEAGGHDWSGKFLMTDAWVLKDGKWQVASRHASWIK